MIADSPTNDEAGELLSELVSLYNAGVRTRNFSGLLALLADDAVFTFEGTSDRGPLVGKPAIAQHFQDDPPDDAVRIVRWKRQGNEIAAQFGWLDIPEGGGCLYVEPRNGRVLRLTIAFGGPRRAFR